MALRYQRRFSRPRDHQRGKVYASEQSLPEWMAGDFTSDTGMAAFAEQVATSPYVQQHWPQYRGTKLKVRFHRGHRTSTAYILRNEIAFSRFHRSVMIVLHELAHLVSSQQARHGPEFVRNYLRLVRHFKPAVYPRLKSAMGERGVQW